MLVLLCVFWGRIVIVLLSFRNSVGLGDCLLFLMLGGDMVGDISIY